MAPSMTTPAFTYFHGSHCWRWLACRKPFPIRVFSKCGRRSPICGARPIPGTAVFLTRTLSDTPPVVVWHVKHNKSLHDHLFVLRVVIEVHPVDQGVRALGDDRGCAEFLARDGPLWIHGDGRIFLRS